MPVFGRFDYRAQGALNIARQAAVRFRHAFIGSEHMLIALLTVARNVVPGLPESVNVNNVTGAVREVAGEGETAPARLELSAHLKAVVERAVLSANQGGQALVTCNQLWNALLSETECTAVRILTGMGCDPDQLRRTILPVETKPQQTPTVRLQFGAAPQQDGQGENDDRPAYLRYGRDLTESAKKGELDPVIGRDSETERMVQILSRRTKNNPVLIGEPGVGKSAVAEGLAQLMAGPRCPAVLAGKRLISVDLTSMVAGSKFRGEFEERVRAVVEDTKKDGNIILFIDEIQQLVGAGKAEGSMDAAGILKPALSRGEIQLIGATTLDDYRKSIEKDAALSRRFQPVLVDEPDDDTTYGILVGLRHLYEEHHHLEITDEALREAVRLSRRYIQDRFEPDKAIDLMDEAASRVRMRTLPQPLHQEDEEKELSVIREKKQEAIDTQDYEQAATLRSSELRLSEKLRAEKAAWEEEKQKISGKVTADDIAQVVALWTGIPVQRLNENESEKLLRLEDTLHARVVGQQEAVSAVSRAIRRARAGLKDPRRPMGSFLFLGPTGVGKTELCKALAQALFGDESAMIRLDMSEYMEKHTTSRMVGSPPGYVGYEEGGQLTEAVRRRPYSVVLFDEIEKAHPDVFNVLLQILEDGRLTDNTGRVVSFANTVIVMTSNAGARMIRAGAVGFGGGAGNTEFTYEQMKGKILAELKNAFRPEFLNRIDETIVFHSLTREDTRQIASMMIREVENRLHEQGIALSCDESVADQLAQEGYDETYGARPLRRVVQQRLEDTLSEELLSGRIKIGDTVSARAEDGRLIYTRLEQQPLLVEAPV